MAANSVGIVGELPRSSRRVGGSQWKPLAPRFEFFRLYVENSRPVRRWEEAYGYEPVAPYVMSRYDDYGALTADASTEDLVFLHDGTLPAFRAAPDKPVASEQSRVRQGWEHPIETTEAFAIYMQQIGKMG